jgi:hypothetical protein
MDAVPSIPEEQSRIQTLTEAMVDFGSDRTLAEVVAKFAGAVTDNRLPNYVRIDSQWLISNSEGYARWFESRVKLAKGLVEMRAAEAKTSVDKLPAHRWKAPLQRVVQILKRHRDVMFAESPDSKPISIILTTLSAQAYRGEQDIASALESVLANMGSFVQTMRPRVPNPVNPVEDFADKWSQPAYQHLNLEQSFWTWLKQAQSDFAALQTTVDASFLSEHSSHKFGIALSSDMLAAKLGLEREMVVKPSVQQLTHASAKPWLKEE